MSLKAIYDPSTHEKIRLRTPDGKVWCKARQEELDVKVDGVFGRNTKAAWEIVYGHVIKVKADLPPFRMPYVVKKWGYHHVGGWPIRARQWETLTAPNRWRNGFLRLVSGRRGPGLYSRPPASWVSLDTASMGIAHWWSKRIPKVFSEMIDELTYDELATMLDHDEESIRLCLDREAIKTVLGKPKSGHTLIRTRHLPLIRAWIALNRFSRWQKIQGDYIIDSIIPPSIRIIHSEGWGYLLRREEGGHLLALVARAFNSSPTLARRITHAAATSGKGAIHGLKEAYYRPRDEGGYGHPERFRKIMSEPRFKRHYEG